MTLCLLRAKSSGNGSRPSACQGGFTLVEMIVATCVCLVAGGLCLSMFRLSLTLTAKNISLNDSNAALQTSFSQVLATMESSILVDCANFDPASQTFTPLAAGTWGNTVRFMRLLPVTVYVLPDDGSSYTMDNPPASTRLSYLKKGSSAVNVTYNAALYPFTNPPASARFYPSFPATSELVSNPLSKSPGTKPGLGIASVSNATVSNGLGKATINLTNALVGDRTVSDCTHGYILVEAALTVIPETTNGPKRLLYFDDTTLPANYVVVCPSLDATDQSPPDAAPAGTTYPGCFRCPVGVGILQTVLPIRSRDYSNAITLSLNGGAQAETNTWVRLSPQFRQRGTL